MFAVGLLSGSLAAASVTPFDTPRFDSIGDAESIPDGVVSSLAEDANGFLWIGTPDGLVRYDGHRFRWHGDRWSDPDTEASMFVRSLLRTRDGRLWGGTDLSGLAAYHPNDERLESVRIPGQETLLMSSPIFALGEDRDGSLWVGSGGIGLFERSATGQWQQFLADGSAGALPDSHVQALLADSDGDLWVGTWHGLARRARHADVFQTIGGAAQDSLAQLGGSISQIFEAADGRLWVGSRDGDLVMLDRHSLHASTLDSAPVSGRSARSAVYAFAQPTSGQVWVGRASGIEIRDAGDGRLLGLVRHDPARTDGLAGSEVRAMLRDRAGLVWAGGYGGGVQLHNPANRAFRIRGRDAVLNDPNVRSVLELRDGRILLGTQESGVAVLGPDLQMTGLLHTADGEVALQGGRVTGLAQAKSGRVWLGGDAGLFGYDLASRDLHAYSVGQGRTRRLLVDSEDRLWVATQDGLYRQQAGVDRMQPLRASDGSGFSGDVNALDMQSDGTVWIGGDQGLARAPVGSEALEWIVVQLAGELVRPEVLGLLVDRDNRIWYDTPMGLYRLHADPAAGWRAIAVSADLGIAGRPFGANLLQDVQGRIWTHQFVYDPIAGRATELTPADGVDIGTGWFRSYARTHDGNLMFGGSKGLLVVDPMQYRASEYAPPVVVSELKIDGLRQNAGRAPAGVVLTPGQRSLSVEFSALDFSGPDRCLFEFRLDGYDTAWTRSDSEYRVASYANLPPGNYRLDIRGSNRSGRWSPNTLAIPLRVLPAWWQTWWFRTLLGLSALAAVVAIVQLRTAVLRGRQRLLERKVGERTAELQAVSEALQRKSRELEEASLTDPLTGLRNRRFLTEYVETDIAQSLRRHDDILRRSGRRENADLIYFLVDLDLFKQVNDVHGHAAGDAVLVQMRARLQGAFRDSDYLVRWGGEEFLIVSRDTCRDNAADLAERARLAVASVPFELPDGTQLAKTCSIGFASFPFQPAHPRAMGWAEVVELADLALYAAKRAGRNGWVGVTSNSDQEIAAERIHHLAELLREGRVTVHSSLDAQRVREAILG